MIPQQVIARKRDGGELEPAVLETFLEGYLKGGVGDEQMSAFLMAVYFQGLGPGELGCLTRVMLHSGEILDFSHLPGPSVDKHSTGGVGDKVSLVLAPLAAEMGLFVPMMAGRGLAHTGGTIDKLESIPGFDTGLSLDRFRQAVEEVGVAIIGQSDEIAPLDRRLYGLRDLTGTASSVDLITASILSKKLAEGIRALVLDVKVGRGALLPGRDDAVRLARTMVAVGRDHGLPMTAVLTAMDRPLGRAVGNALEVREALSCLAGEGPADLRQISLRLAAEMALAAGLFPGLDEALSAAESSLDSGGALTRFARMVRAQGGRLDPEDPDLPAAPLVHTVEARASGVVQGVDPLALGFALIALGGGRTRPGQAIDHRVGFEILVTPGDTVAAGEPVARVHVAEASELVTAKRAVAEAVSVDRTNSGAVSLPLFVDRIT